MRVTLCVCACVCLCLCWPRGLLQNFYCRCRCRYTSLIFSISISILFLSSRSTSRWTWTWTWMSMSMWLATFPMFFSLSTHLCVALASPAPPPCIAPLSPPPSCTAFQNINSKRIARIEIVKCHLIVAVFLSFPFSIFCFSFFIFIIYVLSGGRRRIEGREPTFPWLFFSSSLPTWRFHLTFISWLFSWLVMRLLIVL